MISRDFCFLPHPVVDMPRESRNACKETNTQTLWCELLEAMFNISAAEGFIVALCC